jgi:hypothetical protein
MYKNMTKFLQCWVQPFQIGRLLAVRHKHNTKTKHNSALEHLTINQSINQS